MKKIIALTLVVALCFSFAACGTNIDKLKESPECNFETIYNECKNNITAAKDTYIGKTYRFSGTVEDIEDNFISLTPVSFPSLPSYGSRFSSPYLVKVYMSVDDIKKVKTREVVNVVGKISDLTNSSVEMEKGVFIDNVINFEGEIEHFLLDESYTKHIMKIKYQTADGKLIYNYTVGNAEKFENIEQATIKDIVFTEGDYIKGTARLVSTGYSDSFDIIEIISIEK